MSRVLLYDPYDDFLCGPREFTPLGILYLSAWLKRRGHEVRVLHDEPEEIPAGYTFYGVSATTPQYPKALRALKRIWIVSPQALTVLGGAHMNAARCRQEAMGDGWDYVVQGEGEIALQRIVEEKPAQREWVGPKVPAVDLPMPDREAIDIRQYGFPIRGRKAATLMTARECPFLCQFCSSAGGRPRFSEVDQVMEEVRYLVEELGFRALLFVDDVFTFKVHSRLLPLCERLKKYQSRHDVIWRCYSRTDLGLEALAAMREAGCVEVGAGVESGAQDILDVTMKYTTVKDNLEFIKACAKADIMPNTFLMLGLPGETELTARQTRVWFAAARDLYARYNPRPLHWGWNLFTPLPDCPNRLVWEADGVVPEKTGPGKKKRNRYAGARMRDLITLYPMPYEKSVMKARKGYIDCCFVATDTGYLEGGIGRERMFELYEEGLEWFSQTGFDPRERGART